MKLSKAPCRYFQQGYCANGNACEFLHVAVDKKKQSSAPGPRAVPMVAKPQGGIAVASKHEAKGGAAARAAGTWLGAEDDAKYETETFMLGETPPGVSDNEEERAGVKAGSSFAAMARQGVQLPENPILLPETAALTEEEIAWRKELKARVDASAKTDCGICLENVLQKGLQFGLLDGCDHLFCVECIR